MICVQCACGDERFFNQIYFPPSSMTLTNGSTDALLCNIIQNQKRNNICDAVWNCVMKERFMELWQQYFCLYDVSKYHDRVIKDKSLPWFIRFWHFCQNWVIIYIIIFKYSYTVTTYLHCHVLSCLQFGPFLENKKGIIYNIKCNVKAHLIDIWKS